MDARAKPTRDELPSLCRVARGLDDRSLHVRMQRAKIFVAARVVEVKEKLSSVSSAFDLNTRADEVIVCGISSLLRQVTVVAAFTVSVGGAKAKLSILTAASSARAETSPDAVAAIRRAAQMEVLR